MNYLLKFWQSFKKSMSLQRVLLRFSTRVFRQFLGGLLRLLVFTVLILGLSSELAAQGYKITTDFTGSRKYLGGENLTFNDGTVVSGAAIFSFKSANIPFNVHNQALTQKHFKVRILLDSGQHAIYALSVDKIATSVPAESIRALTHNFNTVRGFKSYGTAGSDDGRLYPQTTDPPINVIAEGSIFGTFQLLDYNSETILDSVSFELLLSGSVTVGLSISLGSVTSSSISFPVEGINLYSIEVPATGRPGVSTAAPPEIEGLDFDYQVTNNDDTTRSLEVFALTPDGQQISLTNGAIDIAPGQTLQISGSQDLPPGTQIFVVPTGALDPSFDPSFVVGASTRTQSAGNLTFNPADDFTVRLNVDNQSGAPQIIVIQDGERPVETIAVGNGQTTVDRNYALESASGLTVTTQSGTPVEQIGGGTLSVSELNLRGAIVGGSGTVTTSGSSVIGSDGSTTASQVVTTTNPDGTTSTTVSNTNGFTGSIPLPPEITEIDNSSSVKITGDGDVAGEIRRIDAEALGYANNLDMESGDLSGVESATALTDSFNDLEILKDSLSDNGKFMSLPTIPAFSGDVAMIDKSFTLLGANFPLKLDFTSSVWGMVRLCTLIFMSVGFLTLSYKTLKI
ncbi:MAG: hypothetical protein QM496_05695 [Verrucomicrobiota bacterium]